MEVLVALGLTMLVLVTLLPQLLVGLRSTNLGNEATEAKGVVQGQLEQLRNLPYFVAVSAERRIDLLDTYFPDLRTPSTPTFTCKNGTAFVTPAAGWSGYVPAATSRCGYEPAIGSFYRKVETEGGYVLVTDTQFLDSLRRVNVPATQYAPAVAEAVAPYDSQACPLPLAKNCTLAEKVAGSDTPISSEVGVTVTVFFLDRGALHPVSAYTQISEVVRTPTRILGVANARALEVGGLADDRASLLSLSVGDVNISGTLTRSSSVTASTDASSARFATADALGEHVFVVAPPAVSTTSRSAAAGTVPASTGCATAYLCWGAGVLDPVTLSAQGGLPIAGSAASPVEARLSAGAPAVGFRNVLDASLLRPALLLDAAQPLVATVFGAPAVSSTACGPTRGGLISGRGFLQTTATQVDSCAAAATTQIALFPTSFAPAGVVQLTLTSAQARCTVDRAAAVVAQASYQLTVKYLKLGVYQSVTINGATGTTPTGLPPLSTTVSLIPPRTLGDYIDTWALAAPTRSSSSATTATASVPGALTLTSQPIRTLVTDGVTGPDPDSGVSLTVGSVSCDAEDAR